MFKNLKPFKKAQIIYDLSEAVIKYISNKVLFRFPNRTSVVFLAGRDVMVI